MTKKTVKGTIGEHKAIIQLMEDGYHVAKSVDPHCPFDLVAVGEEGDVKLIDVKTVSYRKNTKPNWTKKSKKITFSKFLSYIIVSIISFSVFVILIDTIKTPLIDIFPGLEILLFNLFETLQDIKLFIIDLS